MIFGGTTEGRLLAEYCVKNEIPAWISVVSDYGKELLEKSPWLHVVCRAMEETAMRGFLREKKIELAVDATHPYARAASENIGKACKAEGVRLLRCLRDEDGEDSMKTVKPYSVSDIEEAVSFLKEVKGSILVTTGSRELAAFTGLPDYQERIFARVLPSSKVLKECEELGIGGKHLIAMQGPFSKDMNEAVIKQTGVSWMVTKASGAAGGFREKMEAAAACGIGVVLIERKREIGFSVEEVCREISAYWEEKAGFRSETGSRKQHGQQMSEEAGGLFFGNQKRKVILAGIGMGSAGQMTLEVRDALQKSDAVLGASRMLNAVKAVLDGTGKYPVFASAYLEEDVMALFAEHPEWRRITVAYSGDSGFYSGTAKLAERLKREGIPFRILPGISSVSYLAARMQKPWEHAAIHTAHGRSLDVRKLMERGEETFFILMGGENGAGTFCRELVREGFGAVQITVGENLSYPDEKIQRGTAAEMAKKQFGTLSLVYLERTGMTCEK